MYEEEIFEGVAIATASAGQPSWEYTVSLLGLKYPARVFRLATCEKEGLDYGRNKLIHWFLYGSQSLYLLLLDDDAVVHPDTIERLLSWGKPVVSALSVQRRPPYVPVAWRDHDREGFQSTGLDTPTLWLDNIRAWVIKHPLILRYPTQVLKPRPDDALVQVRAGSAHCLLIDRDVLQDIEPPWFAPGESFYEKAGECYVDRSCVAGHMRAGVAGLLDFAVFDRCTNYGRIDIEE